MTPSELRRLDFTEEAVRAWAPEHQHHTNWPVVYLIDDAAAGIGSSGRMRDVYVGESLNVASRMRQHLESPAKQHLRSVRVILNETFNKSACLDLEAYLIRMLAGDGSYRVLNRNDGVTESDYYDRARYREGFRQVFDALTIDGVFTRSIPEIENSDLFKLSPFKSLTHDQAIAVEDILDGLREDVARQAESTVVIQGDPGTGKTVIAIYLLKLLADIANIRGAEDLDADSMFAEFFVGEFPALIRDMRIGIVIPQQSLRQSIKRVFSKTPGLTPAMVVTPYDVGKDERGYDLLVVDEAHRLNQRANQPSAAQNTMFRSITETIFGSDDRTKTQLDWIIAKSKHRIFLLDAAQSVRPADLPPELLASLQDEAKQSGRHYPLVSQLRVRAEGDYVGFVREVLNPTGRPMPPRDGPAQFGQYDFQLFESLGAMRDAIKDRDREHGLARMVAGYAWEWKSRHDKSVFDIEEDGVSLRWNGTQTDWIASAGSLDEVGSIHTVQGYDLNYVGVIIGSDLRFDAATQRLFVERQSYFDKKGKENNPTLGKVYSDEDLLRFITNIYAVLLTRGIRGTYVYVCDPALRKYLKRHVPAGVRRD
jgi:DUF2075 family protein